MNSDYEYVQLDCNYQGILSIIFRHRHIILTVDMFV